MTIQTIQFESISLAEVGSGTLTAFLFSGATLSATLASITENGTLRGRYTGTVTSIPAGTYRLVVKFDGITISEPNESVSLLLAVGTYVATEAVELDSAAVRAALGMASADLDQQLGAILAAATAGAGTGARTVTVTVNDGTNVLQNALVRFTEGANTFRALTNASGVAVFNLDDATYVVAVTKSGYSFAGSSMVVNGTEAATYSMTVVSVTPPDDPALCTVTVHLRNQYGADLQEQPVEITWIKWGAGAAETPPVLSVPLVQTTNADGLVQVNLYRNAVYKIVYGNAPYSRRLDVTIPDAGTHEVEI